MRITITPKRIQDIRKANLMNKLVEYLLSGETPESIRLKEALDGFTSPESCESARALLVWKESDYQKSKHKSFNRGGDA